MDEIRYRIKKVMTMFVDIALLSFAALISLWLHDSLQMLTASTIGRSGIWMLALLAIPVYTACGFYAQIWRYASISQYLFLFGGTSLHTALTGFLLQLINRPLPVSFFIIFWMTSFILIVGARVFYRILLNHRVVPFLAKIINTFDNKAASEEVIRVMVIGAGQAGSQIIRELVDVRSERQPVAVIDDNPAKQHLRILGIPVVGGRDQIVSAVNEYKIREIILAMPSASKDEMRAIVRICSQLPCKMRTLPSLTDLVNGKVSFSQTKDVEIEDLLGRQPIELDQNQISSYLTSQVVLVTGGGGSIGSELCRKIAHFKPERLIILDIYENNAFELEHELRHQFPDLELSVVIGSIRDRLRLEMVFEQFRPQVVFHAAAHKHVPLMEDNPCEAVKNNIMGTLHMAQVAAQYKADRFVLISTDKAVNPTNVMGASKRIAEMIVQTINEQVEKTVFTAVRFGNVLGSNGSVIPLFKRQIAQQRRVTVTDPGITRYFMTIPEAAGLVIQAGAQAKGGEIFVLDMGEPVKIDDLARDLIRLSGLKPDIDVEIVYTGLRPGEKMFEELYLDSENMLKTKHEKIMMMQPVCQIQSIRHEIEMLRHRIRWDNNEFRVLRQELLNGYSQIVLKNDCDLSGGSQEEQNRLMAEIKERAKAFKLIEMEAESEGKPCPVVLGSDPRSVKNTQQKKAGVSNSKN